MIVGRIQVDGETDLPAVHAIQDQFTLAPVEGNSRLAGPPRPDPRVSGDLGFWERFRVDFQAYPPPAGDADIIDLAASAGLRDDESPFVNPDPDLATALRAGAAKGRQVVDSLASGGGTAPGSWTSGLHMFDYNLDRCGPGTIDSPQWKIGDRKKAYVTRAVAARAGLWGNHGYEADYEVVHQDEHGDTLNGAHRYEVTFNPPPPANVFWSFTMYDTPKYYLVANPIDRYSIGDRTPACVTPPMAPSPSTSRRAGPTVTRTRTGSRHQPVTSARSCACTNPARQSSTAPTRFPRSGGSTNRNERRTPSWSSAPEGRIDVRRAQV